MIVNSSNIYALSSGTGGAIALLRISGYKILDKLIPCLYYSSGKKVRKISPRQMTFCVFNDPQSQEDLDEIYVVYFPAGKSYTGEELVEIHSHGSRAIIKRFFEVFDFLGFHAAKPGEFTRRAFLNGRIGLSQAEAIRELIEADTLAQANIALKVASGKLKSHIQSLRETLIDVAAHLEATLDYPEEDIDFLDPESFIHRVQEIEQELTRISQSYARFKLCREGIQLAILGKPNAGKSSLLNALLQEDRAIVTHLEGTTRDHIEESFETGGIKYRLVDTAGIRDSEDLVEKIGIEKSLQIEKDSKYRVYIYDGSKKVELRESSPSYFHLLNKSDLGIHSDNQCLTSNANVFDISAVEGTGLDIFLKRLCEVARQDLDLHGLQESHVLTSERQKQAVDKASNSLFSLRTSLSSGIPLDIALVDLYEAMDHLGELTGEVLNEDIIDRIFEKFCIGK